MRGCKNCLSLDVIDGSKVKDAFGNQGVFCRTQLLKNNSPDRLLFRLHPGTL